MHPKQEQYSRSLLTRVKQNSIDMLAILDLDIVQLPRYGILLEPAQHLDALSDADKLDILLYTLDSTMAGDTSHLLERILGSEALSSSTMSLERSDWMSLTHILAFAHATEVVAKLTDDGCSRSASPTLIRYLRQCAVAKAPSHHVWFQERWHLLPHHAVVSLHPQLVMLGSWVNEQDCDLADAWTFFSGRYKSG
ncbi:hypothetical protein DOTSEDRAFT_49229 [Dothistroma septosporum NZE10]|uniref:Uncharacterized protein n=1 Tax=Dothistroma septosporum (strain NZE10 / CBS 128990) TaxID=675120 RepID=N1Q2G1_DOTSN|nr:hypothetical protein DOTSEDRAFT_49229 [Dothistroma septosporum NZE10]